jgi:hypothetical protein
MTSFFRNFLLGIVGFMSAAHLVLAVDGTPGKIHHFTIIAPPTAKVGEAIDVTVEAKDKDDKIITNYRGSIFFQSDTDFGATIPAQGKAIQFKESDNGVLKISKGVIFKRVGNQELTVTEALEDVGGSIKIRVEDGSTTQTPPTSESITITTPEKGSTVTNDTVMMSGKTKKNSKVLIKLNGAEVGNAISNDDGIYTFKLMNINQQSNILSASVVDGTNTVIGNVESQFSFSAKAPAYYNLSISPSNEVDTGTGISLLVDAEPGLSAVEITLDGTLLVAQEQSPGKYSVSSLSPAKPGSYPVQVNIKNVLGQMTSKSDAAILTTKAAPIPVTPPVVEAPKPAFKNVMISSDAGRVNINFFVENAPSDLSQFKIAYGENADALSNEVTTYPLEKIRQENGSYSWYIDKLPAKSYSFKIF